MGGCENNSGVEDGCLIFTLVSLGWQVCCGCGYQTHWSAAHCSGAAEASHNSVLSRAGAVWSGEAYACVRLTKRAAAVADVHAEPGAAVDNPVVPARCDAVGGTAGGRRKLLMGDEHDAGQLHRRIGAAQAGLNADRV